MKHEFGGIWTRKKLMALDAYLRFYLTALKNMPFTLHYADAFAGTGKHSPLAEDDQAMLVPYEDFKGSVMTALDILPGFDHFHFNDLNPDHVKELHKIKGMHPNRNITVSEMDANQFVPKFCASLKVRDRAVLFLDPYSTQLDWNTLKDVANSGRVDLWLLFPISVILRMTPKDGAKVVPEWKNTITRLLGTGDWEQALYKHKPKPLIEDMFGQEDTPDDLERINTSELEEWVSGRLKEIFPYVAKPLPLNNKGRPLFLFYFAVSNKDEKAWRLADRAASQIIKTVGN